jgi:hypothetical protein
MTTSLEAAAKIVGKERPLTQWEQRGAVSGAVILALTVTACVLIPSSLVHFQRITGEPSYVQDGFYKQAYLRLDTILAGVFLGAYLLTPAAAAAIAWLRPRWRNAYTYGALAGVCAFMSCFLVHFGRWQFDGFDFNIVVDLGWRQILGQQPYVDFPATTPPGFHLGIKYGFELFGVNWDAILYVSAIFASATFLWMYWTMRRLSMGRLASIAVAFAIECAAMLTHCFWSYNNTTLILAAVFFLSCLLYARSPQSVAVQASYVVSLMLLSLMKGNIAGLMIAGGVMLLFFATRHKVRLIMLTLGAAVAALAVLALNHVPIGAMLTSYLGVAARRGSISARLAYAALSPFERHSSVFWVSVLSLPLLGALPKLVKQIGQRDWRGVASTLLFPLTLLVVIYGVQTNGDFRDLECTALLAAGGVITFGLRWNGTVLRRITIAILCASIAGDLYYGAARTFVYLGGPHMFFEWQDNEHRIDSGFLKNMRVGAPMIEIEREVKQALDTNPGPYFLGPRLDFNYAAFGLPSPEGYPVTWAPETMFPLSAEPQIIQNWKQDRLRTLIFIKDLSHGRLRVLGLAYSYYPQEFLDIIDHAYVRDDESYTDITIYRLREPN